MRVELLLGQLFEPDGCGVENRLGLQGRNEFLAEAVQDGAKRSAHGEGIHPANHFDKLASVRVTFPLDGGRVGAAPGPAPQGELGTSGTGRKNLVQSLTIVAPSRDVGRELGNRKGPPVRALSATSILSSPAK